MSISNLLVPNNENLFSNSLSTTENTLTSYSCYDSSGNSIGVSISLKWTYCGLACVYYSSFTATSSSITNSPYIQLGSSSTNFLISGLPQPQASGFYPGTIYAYVGGVLTPLIMEIQKVNSTQCTIKIYKQDLTNFTGVTLAFGPFTFFYDVQS